MPGIPDIDFHLIAPRLGGKREAFEELCCQLAHRHISADASFVRLNGAGGDGGVECYADLPDQTRIGWQAKYVFDVEALIAQADSSLSTALEVHATLTHYVVCFPFNLTGPTRRRGRSGQQKFEEWRDRRITEAAGQGRDLLIEAWPESKLRSLLCDLDLSGGLRFYFFDETVLDTNWFSRHLDQVIASAGPRYTPELSVETELFKWMDTFGRMPSYVDNFEIHLRLCRETQENLEESISRTKADKSMPDWPDVARSDARTLLEKTEEILGAFETMVRSRNERLPIPSRDIIRMEEILGICHGVEQTLLEDLQTRHPGWKGNVDSPTFRQYMSEYECCFSTANVDKLREAAEALQDFHDWLRSPEGFLFFAQVFLLTGEAGVGKTHGICDIARRRVQDGLPTCVVFGHRFGGEPDPWTRILEILGLPVVLGREGLLDVLSAAGEARGYPLLLCIDAINETRPLRYWRDHLGEILQAVGSRPYIKMCISCRTPYVPNCIPEGIDIRQVEYRGFAGLEDYACRQFFEFYGLEPPVHPILQPELKNPLYLRLVCETLRSQGKRSLPAGWQGLAPVVDSFISQKEKDFAVQYDIAQGANVVGYALRVISREVAHSGNSAISRSSALRVVRQARPVAENIPVVDWLIRNGLLIEEAPVTDGPFGEESAVRPAFERLGDFFVANSLLADISSRDAIQDAFQPGGKLHYLIRDEENMDTHEGVLGALSILIPEKHKEVELADLVDDRNAHRLLLKVTFDNLSWRSPESFSPSTVHLLRQGLQCDGMSFGVMDAVLSMAWNQSPIDAFWLDDVLQEKRMAKRDAFWCTYLHLSYESSGVVRRLIDAAIKLPLNRMESGVLERWSVLLSWFTAAADRRVGDSATRAMIRIFEQQPNVIAGVVERFLGCDDDAVRERVFLAAYGALILTRDVPALRRLAGILCGAFRDRGAQFDNALIRDHIRCVLELSEHLEVLPKDCTPALLVDAVSADWPLTVPDDEQIKKWSEVVHFKPDEFYSDFFKYSMTCLQPWNHAMQKSDMGKWILQRVARDFGYVGSNCEICDAQMLRQYGGGRAKPVWAERIGKKYQWIAMYQLASRLHDHVARQRDSWEPEPLRPPLILLKGRKLDPTLPPELSEEKDTSAWWIAASPDLDSGRQYSDAEWVSREDNLPESEKLLSVVEHGGQKWRLLVSYPFWKDPNQGYPYRHMWMHIKSYLVEKKDFDIAHRCLYRRNFFGNWMPETASWSYGFAGEYPWATPFNTETEEWHGRGGVGEHGLPVAFNPSWSRLPIEWEYDASSPCTSGMLLPARTFFSLSDLWWNGEDGYRLVDTNKTIFCNPSLNVGGPISLLVDADDLLKRLDKLGLRLIWTLLGEKEIISESFDRQTPRRTFSQTACLNIDGSLHAGKRVFFDDYNKDTCPNPTGKNAKEEGN